MSWNLGHVEKLFTSLNTQRCGFSIAISAEGEDVEFKNSVDLANESRPAIDLLEEFQGMDCSVRKSKKAFMQRKTLF